MPGAHVAKRCSGHFKRRHLSIIWIDKTDGRRQLETNPTSACCTTGSIVTRENGLAVTVTAVYLFATVLIEDLPG